MRTRLPLLALLILAVAVGLHLFRAENSSATEGVTPDGDEVSTEVQPDVEPGDTLPGANRTPQNSTAQGAAGTGSDQELGTANALDPSESLPDPRELAWMELYGGLDVPGLRTKLYSLEARFINDRDQALEDRFTLGQYETYRPGDLPPPLSDDELNSPPPISETRTGTDPDTLQLEAHVVNLSPKEYGALYDLQAEIDWLKDKIGE